MATVAWGRQGDEYAEKKMKKNKMVLELSMDYHSKTCGGINHLAMGGEGLRGRAQGVAKWGKMAHFMINLVK